MKRRNSLRWQLIRFRNVPGTLLVGADPTLITATNHYKIP